MEAGSSGGSDKNQVYGLSNTRADNLRTTRTASTVGSSQSVSSSQSKEFVALQQRCDHLSEAYTQLKERPMKSFVKWSSTWHKANICTQSKLAA
ncbi:hypothetical protein D5086_002709 [Populus alba]|uniref:Uncharacterized protein n=1 Tax=Populus alba TaxID=43335 RepID=A0ACC4D327_POPAL